MGKTSKRKAKLLSTTGNILIALSVVGVLTIFYPIIKEELSYRTSKVYNENPVSQSFNIRIPSLKINSRVLENVDPWNKTEYLEALKQGVAHAKGSSLPYQNGSVYLFAHSSDAPWNLTRYNAEFFRLGRIKKGEDIFITYNGEEKRYSVREIIKVWPTEVEHITKQDKDQLILQTCTPIGTSLKRLLVFADPIKEIVED